MRRALRRTGLGLRGALPFAALAVFGATLWRCLGLMRGNGHLEQWRHYDVPMISMLGLDEPEHTTFAYGFTLLGLLVGLTLVLRDRQLAREPAIERYRGVRRTAVLLGLFAMAMLLVVAWVPGSEPAHFLGALAMFAALSLHAALHTGLCLAIRRAPRGPRPWPGRGLYAFMLLCPTASLACVALWVETDSARAQWLAVALQFAYFLAIAPALGRDATESVQGPATSASPFAPSLWAVLVALLLALLLIPARIAEHLRLPCAEPVSCVASSPDRANCEQRALAQGYVAVEVTAYSTHYCPKPQQESALWSHWSVQPLKRVGLPLVGLLGALGLALALFAPERAGRALGLRRRALARVALALTTLCVALLTLGLLRSLGSRWPPPLESWAPYLLAASVLGLAQARGDRLLRDDPHGGFSGALVLAAAAFAAGVAAGLGLFADSLRRGAADARPFGLDVARRVLADTSLEALQSVQRATVAVSLPLCAVCWLAALGDLRAERAELSTFGRRLALAAVAVTMALHLFSGAALPSPDWVRLLALLPLAVLAWGMLGNHAPSRTTRLCLVAALVVANAACVLFHTTRWLHQASMDASVTRTTLVAAHLSALRWAELRALFDLVVCSALLARSARAEGPNVSHERRGLLAALSAWALTGVYAACLVFALGRPVSSMARALEALRPAAASLPELDLDSDAPLQATYFVAADGNVLYADPNAKEPSLRPASVVPAPKYCSVAAAGTLTLSALERALEPHVDLNERPLLFALERTDLEAPAPPETSLFGLARPTNRPLRLGAVTVSWFVPHERWARRERLPAPDPYEPSIIYQRAYGLVGAVDAPTLFNIEYPAGRLRLEPGADVSGFLCPHGREPRAPERHVLVLPIDDGETVESVLRRFARVDPDRQPRSQEPTRPACGFSRVVLSRERAYLESLLR